MPRHHCAHLALVGLCRQCTGCNAALSLAVEHPCAHAHLMTTLLSNYVPKLICCSVRTQAGVMTETGKVTVTSMRVDWC